jgi:hypothetical protein
VEKHAEMKVLAEEETKKLLDKAEGTILHVPVLVMAKRDLREGCRIELETDLFALICWCGQHPGPVNT